MNKYAQRLMFLFGAGGIGLVVGNAACLEDLCADSKTAEFRSLDDLAAMRILSFAEVMQSSQRPGAPEQLAADGRNLALRVNRPVKMPDGSIAMPDGWLPPIPDDHPWADMSGPGHPAFDSFFEERVVRPRLYDPENATHQAWARAYLDKARSNSPEFPGYTYAERTECVKKKFDAPGTCPGGNMADPMGNCPKIDAF